MPPGGGKSTLGLTHLHHFEVTLDELGPVPDTTWKSPEHVLFEQDYSSGVQFGLGSRIALFMALKPNQAFLVCVLPQY